MMARKFMRKKYGPGEFQRKIRGLVKAAKVIAAEEKINRDQLELFDKMKTEAALTSLKNLEEIA
jgi:hypothetical protein